MKRLLLLIPPIILGTTSPGEEEFIFDFINPDSQVFGSSASANAVVVASENYVLPQFADLSDQEIAWLEFGFGEDLWNPSELNYGTGEAEALQEIANSHIVEEVAVNPVAESSMASPSKRPRGRPPKLPAKSATTTKPERVIAKSTKTKPLTDSV